ncbi:MAG: DegT/DnrJ/EryC1/StrS family aminotransferase [Verrucomicrobiota bacterium]
MNPHRKIHIAQPTLGDEEWEALKEPISTGWLTQGPKVAAFETRFAELHEVEHALATTSCTTALHLALVALGIGPGDDVLVPAFTWVASANAVEYTGARAVFVDVRRDTYNLDPEQIAAKLSDRTKAIMAVHLFGLCADIEAIKAAAPGIPIIEDAACAAGARYRGTSAGALGEMGCFSFHPRKTITTGEGGMLTTNDDGLAERCTKLRNHGAEISEEQRHHGPRPYILPDFNLMGFNYRMTDLQGAVGCVQIERLQELVTERRKRARSYSEQFEDLDWFIPPNVPEGYDHSWQAYVGYVDEDKAPAERNAIMEQLQEKGIGTRPGTHAVHQLGYYRDRYQLQSDDFPAARDCEAKTIAIPLHNRMTDDDYAYVVETMKNL